MSGLVPIQLAKECKQKMNYPLQSRLRILRIPPNFGPYMLRPFPVEDFISLFPRLPHHLE
uniref:Uncharacterized protein n=1 Tax=Arundo donax TaxID=35708 RepID=A0A0A9EB33_ARUDO